nr:LysR substrate-binding domain-containing protein [Azospirillum soli]
MLQQRLHTPTPLIGVATRLEQRVENRLVVAVDELYPEHALGALFADVAHHFPLVELELLFPLMEDVSRMVRDGTADLGVMRRQEKLPVELGFRTIGRVPLTLVRGRDHSLAKDRVEDQCLPFVRQKGRVSATRGPSRSPGAPSPFATRPQIASWKCHLRWRSRNAAPASRLQMR